METRATPKALPPSAAGEATHLGQGGCQHGRREAHDLGLRVHQGAVFGPPHLQLERHGDFTGALEKGSKGGRFAGRQASLVRGDAVWPCSAPSPALCAEGCWVVAVGLFPSGGNQGPGKTFLTARK